MRRALAVALSLLPAVATASPPYPLEGLLARAETVMIARRVPGSRLTFVPTRLFRGASPSALDLTLAGDSQPLAAGDYFLFSQGDAHFGPPTNEVRLGQAIEGQRGYRGWIALPLVRDRDGELSLPDAYSEAMQPGRRFTLRALAALVARHRYRPNL